MLWEAVAGRNYPPTNKNTLIRALTEEWDKLPQQLLDNVVQKEKKTASLLRLIKTSVIHLQSKHYPTFPPTLDFISSNKKTNIIHETKLRCLGPLCPRQILIVIVPFFTTTSAQNGHFFPVLQQLIQPL
ncbi:hypothetical protein TNCV_1484031 [Trichonephila clavipes]|nr:hypothetical protein TNCV_1484031 [Trichonephila clavipes]